MKRIFCSLLALFMILGCASCSGNDSTTTTTTSSVDETTVTTTASGSDALTSATEDSSVDNSTTEAVVASVDSSTSTTAASSVNNSTTTTAATTVNNSTTTTTSSGGSFSPIKVDIDILESNYVTYINEIYTNVSDYVGEIVRIQGMFTAESVQATGNTYYYVYRTGPGCCGNDGSMCGFEFTWSKISTLKENDWIEVTGKLRTYTEGSSTYLTLDAISVNVLDVRGAETVSA